MPAAFRRLVPALLFAVLTPLAAHALELISPAGGTRLHGGSFVALEWKAESLPPETEEWEAFLSVNGGDYYAYRITPHLDSDLRRFVFIVPNVEASDATILIRTGNEIEETLFELPGHFSITRSANAPGVTIGRLASRGAESARPGEPPVLAWVEGARDGTGIAFATALPRAQTSLHPCTRVDEPREAVLPSDGVTIRSPRVEFHRQTTLVSAPDRFDAPLPPRDLLRLGRRLNI